VSLVDDGPADAIPNLIGMSAREAMRTLGKLGLSARLEGDGVVVAQEPAPGQPVEPGDVSRLVLERSPGAGDRGPARPRTSGIAATAGQP
jgi:beta-lactam-binding protein with PASTA domain